MRRVYIGALLAIFFYDGQIFDAFSVLADIIGHAKKEIVLIDGLKDAGKKCFGINKIEGADDVKDIMKKAQQTGT